MKVLIDFFALRPTFTLLGLRLIWFAFLLQQAITLAALLRSTSALALAFRNNYFSSDAWYTILTFLLHIGTNLVLVRVLLEVAAAVLLRNAPDKAVERSS